MLSTFDIRKKRLRCRRNCIFCHRIFCLSASFFWEGGELVTRTVTEFHFTLLTKTETISGVQNKEAPVRERLGCPPFTGWHHSAYTSGGPLGPIIPTVGSRRWTNEGPRVPPGPHQGSTLSAPTKDDTGRDGSNRITAVCLKRNSQTTCVSLGVFVGRCWCSGAAFCKHQTSVDVPTSGNLIIERGAVEPVALKPPWKSGRMPWNGRDYSLFLETSSQHITHKLREAMGNYSSSRATTIAWPESNKPRLTKLNQVYSENCIAFLFFCAKPMWQRWERHSTHPSPT